MPNLVVDIGNSFSKIAVFEDREMVHFERREQLDYRDLDALIKKHAIVKSIMSSVVQDTKGAEKHLAEKIEVVAFNTNYNPGIRNNYQSIGTLGLDRWAKVVAAFELFKNQNVLMIDAGTCITYDLLNSESVYEGGSISLGINMRFKALNHYTGRLPLVDFDSEESIPKGNNTINALKSGVLRGVLNEIEGFIALENNTNTALKVILTGGDSDFLSKQLKNSIFASQIMVDPYLVLRGLNEVIAL